MAGLVIDWMTLETCFESHDPAHRAWLDTATGEIHVVNQPQPGWLRIEAIPSREQYRMMERFIATVEIAALKEALQDAIVGKGAFRRFKDALGRFPDERKRWFAFRDALLHRYILDWLKVHKLELKEIPAWNLEPPMTPTPYTEGAESSPEPTSGEGRPVERNGDKADVEHLKAYLLAWARAHGEEYRYLFGPAAFDRLASDLSQEFAVQKKPRSQP